MGRSLVTILLLTFTTWVNLALCGDVIHIASPIAFTGWSVGIDVASSLELSINQINNRTDILPNNTIVWFPNDTGCDSRVGLGAGLWPVTHANPVAMLSSGCSVGEVPIALLASYYYIPLVSCSSTSPELSNKSLYPSFLRVVPPDNYQGLAWAAITRHYGWNRAATLNSQETIHAELTANFLQRVALQPNFQVVTAESFPGSQQADLTTQLLSIKHKGATLIFMACYEDDAANAIRTAKTLGLIGPQYVWIGTDSWTTNALAQDHPDIAAALVGVIGTRPGISSSPQALAYHAEFEKFANRTPGSYSGYVDFAHDSANVMAQILHDMIEVQQIPYTFPPSMDFKKELLSQLWNFTGTGITPGIIKFDKYGNRISPYDIMFINTAGETIHSSSWDPDTDNFTVYAPVVWFDGTTTVPIDHIPVQTVPRSAALVISFTVLAILCMIITVVLIIFTVIWREQPRIKAATFSFLVYILFSALLSYGVVIFLAFPPSDVTCVAPLWLGHTAFAIAFGCLFTKSFRVWRIFFQGKKLTMVSISNAQLLVVVGSLTALLWIYLAIFTAIARPAPVIIPDAGNIAQQFLSCDLGSPFWYIILSVIEFASLLFGCYLAFQTRKIDLLRYNESTSIAISIYMLVVLGFIFIPVAYFLALPQDTLFLIQAGGTIVATSSVLGALFTPKFRAIIQNKPDKDVKQVTNALSREYSTKGPVRSASSKPSANNSGIAPDLISEINQ